PRRAIDRRHLAARRAGASGVQGLAGAADLAERLRAIGAAADLESMSLPVALDEAQDAPVRRAVVILALWIAEARLTEVQARAELQAALGLDEAERAMLADYRAAPERFSFYN